MKKLFALLCALMMVISLTACSSSSSSSSAEPEPEQEPEPEVTGMTREEFDAASADTNDAVTIVAYVQGAQSYWNGAKLYIQNEEGGYFVYCDGKGEDVNISEEDYAKLVDSTDYSDGWCGIANGTQVLVTGEKSAWAGEVEIANATVTLMDGTWTAEAEDVTALLGTDELESHMNEKVAFTGMTVEPSTDAEGKEVAFLYNWDGSGEPGSDLYFNVSYNGTTYNFCVESYLCYDGSAAYDAVEALEVGQTVDLEGFLYWYNGAQPHITSVTVK